MKTYNHKLIKTKSLKSIVNEVLEQKLTSADMTTEKYIDKLSKHLGYPVVSGPYRDTYVVELEEPHYIYIKHIVKDIFDFEYYRDKSDRTKGTYVAFEDLKKILKDLMDKDLNFVDSAYKKSVDNSKYKEKIENPDSHVVKFSAKEKIEEADDMNDEKDNPDQPMEEVSDYKKLMDYGLTKVKYKQPKLNKEDKKITIKLDKTEKFK